MVQTRCPCLFCSFRLSPRFFFFAARSQLQAGSYVAKDTEIPSGELWGGHPAQSIRKLTEAETASFKNLAEHSIALARKHANEHDKSEAQRQKDRDRADFLLPDETRYKETPF